VHNALSPSGEVNMALLLVVVIVSMFGMFMTLGAYDTQEREKKEHEISTKQK
jgi:hypothetical protein